MKWHSNIQATMVRSNNSKNIKCKARTLVQYCAGSPCQHIKLSDPLSGSLAKKKKHAESQSQIFKPLIAEVTTITKQNIGRVLYRVPMGGIKRVQKYQI